MRPLVPLIVASSVSWARTCSGSSDRLSFVPEKPTTCTDASSCFLSSANCMPARGELCAEPRMQSPKVRSLFISTPFLRLFLSCAKQCGEGSRGTAWLLEGRCSSPARSEWLVH